MVRSHHVSPSSSGNWGKHDLLLTVTASTNNCYGRAEGMGSAGPEREIPAVVQSRTGAGRRKWM